MQTSSTMKGPCFVEVAFNGRGICQSSTTFLQFKQRNQSLTTCRPRRKRQGRQRMTMEWKPAGLIRAQLDLKRVEVEMMEQVLSERPDHPVNMRRSFYAQETVHRLSKSLRRSDGSLAIMASVKRFQAPYPGEKAEVLANLEDIALESRKLESNGVDAALVYTDSIHYGVEVAELGKMAKALKFSTVHFGMPLVRHDLIIDPIQIAEAAEAGACAVNIVAAAALPDLLELLNSATAMGIETIVECHTELERDYAMECGATIIFLNDWDRTQNKLVPGSATSLVDAIPPWVITLGGGGLVTASDCWKLLDAGFSGVVLGRTLLQTQRPAAFIREIRSQKRHSGNIFSGDLGIPFSDGSFK